MKSYLRLGLTFILVSATITYFYFASKNNLTRNHEKLRGLFLIAQNTQTSAQKDMLKSMSFLLKNYDSFMVNEKKSEVICNEFHNYLNDWKGPNNSQLNQVLLNYCAMITEKLAKLEMFKSRNSIYKNSLFYLQKIEKDYYSTNKSEYDNKNLNLRHKLILATLSYSFGSDVKFDKVLESIQKMAPTNLNTKNSNSDLDLILKHSLKIYTTKKELVAISDFILNAEEDLLLDQLQSLYFQSYQLAEQQATSRQRLLFIIWLLFLAVVIYKFTVLKINKRSQYFTELNTKLELKVHERTKELKESQEKIIQQQQSIIAASKMSTLGEMASGIAHEINTPLAVINLKAEMMEDKLKNGSIENEEIIRSFEVIRKTTGRITKIVRGLKFFARNGTCDEVEPALVESLINDTISLCFDKFKRNGVGLELVMDKSLETLQLECRPVEISQVLLNLLNNSFDAIEFNDKKWVKINVLEHNEQVEICVTDSGERISMEIQKKLMEPFFTTKEVGKGTGLGLSISRGIISAHDGQFYIDNNCPNTKFVILLPKKNKNMLNNKMAV